MWTTLTVLIMLIEASLIASFIIGKFQRKKLNETALFIGVVFVVNYSLHLVPFLYEFFVLKQSNDFVLGLVKCLGPSIKMFVGEAKVELVAAFAGDYPLFSYAYMAGSFIAIFATLTAAIEAFSNTIRNNLHLARALKKDVCDIVAGSSLNALRYTESFNCVLLLDNSVSKAAVKELIENGYAVIHKNFSVKLLKGHLLNSNTRYNVICPDEEKALDFVDTFITYKKTEQTAKNIHLYVEIEGDKAENIRREIIEKNGMGAFVNTFCTKELLARTFVEENPVTGFLPSEYIEKASIKPNTEINMFLLGFDKLSNEIYYHSIINNQLVTFDGEYKTFPVNYYLCDTNTDASAWNVTGLKEGLKSLDAKEYFPIPELPFKVNVIGASPSSREIVKVLEEKTKKPNSYTFIIVNTQSDCRNIELGARLKATLFDRKNYHIFVRSEASYTENSDRVTYFGAGESVFNHNTIVNDSLSFIARTLNEVYELQSATDEEKSRPDFEEYIKEKSEKNWNGFSYFLLYSNIYSAMNLRLKLNLLGLDYQKDGKAENLSLISERYGRKDEYSYDEYFGESVRNALLAQEHARWNAYHLMNEYMPLKKKDITVANSNGEKVKFNTKNTQARRHACITTYSGLDKLFCYLAEKANNGSTAADYDCYKYDEDLIIAAEKLLSALGYSITDKKSKEK